MQATDLHGKLSSTQDKHGQLAKQLEAAGAERDAAKADVARLQQLLDNLQFVADEGQAKAEDLQQQVRAAPQRGRKRQRRSPQQLAAPLVATPKPSWGRRCARRPPPSPSCRSQRQLHALLQLSEARSREVQAQRALEASAAQLACCRQEAAELQRDLASRTDALEQLLVKHEQAQLRSAAGWLAGWMAGWLAGWLAAALWPAAQLVAHWLACS
jgi:hypothetical protein